MRKEFPDDEEDQAVVLGTIDELKKDVKAGFRGGLIKDGTQRPFTFDVGHLPEDVSIQGLRQGRQVRFLVAEAPTNGRPGTVKRILSARPASTV